MNHNHANTELDLNEDEEMLILLQIQRNAEEDELYLQQIEEEDIAIIEIYKAELEEEMFNHLLLEFSSLGIRYTVEFLREIWDASPRIYFERERRRRVDRMDFTEQYWLQKHPSLQDPTDENPFSTFAFRDHYRVHRYTFNKIVDKCIGCPEYTGSILRGRIPVEVQVATVLWRFSNCHYGYRIAETTLGVSAGSYHNFTERFLGAMMTISKSVITWPINNPARAAEIANEFQERGDTVRLDEALGAIDGKNFVIQKPSVRGNDYVDRKGRASVNMMAVCDDEGRFMYIKLGISGTGNKNV